MPKIILDILIEDKNWRRIAGLKARIHKAADAAQALLPKKLQLSGQVTVLLTGNAAMRRLNRDFRGLDKPTNVLSFPQFETQELTKIGKKREQRNIGDIALGYQYIVAEAIKDNKILINHTVHLILHGILHLLGYDHRHRAETTQMERLEKRIMASLGLPDPYASQKWEPKAR